MKKMAKPGVNLGTDPMVTTRRIKAKDLLVGMWINEHPHQKRIVYIQDGALGDVWVRYDYGAGVEGEYPPGTSFYRPESDVVIVEPVTMRSAEDYEVVCFTVGFNSDYEPDTFRPTLFRLGRWMRENDMSRECFLAGRLSDGSWVVDEPTIGPFRYWESGSANFLYEEMPPVKGL